MLGLRTPKRQAPGEPKTNFLILVPARNEGRVITQTVRHLLGLEYAGDKRQVVVVADDCDDATAEAAREAGALVLQKAGPASGKGQAMQWALAEPQIAKGSWQALIVLDADSRPRPDFLSVMDGAIAAGSEAVQARTESLAPEGWVARAYAVNTSQRNRTWHQARERAGFSAALTGTGLCLTRALLERFPFAPKTLTEDLEYSAILTRAGVRVSYLYEAVLEIEQPHSVGSSVHQRLRWARGQLMTTFREAPGLLARAVLRRDLSALDTALYLAMPSLVPLQAALVGWIGVSLVIDTSAVRSFPGLGSLSLGVLATGLGLSLTMPFLGLLAERRRVSVRDWLSFAVLMATWIPVAVYGAMTVSVRSWRPTPHGIRLKAGAGEHEEEPSVAFVEAENPASTG